MVGQNTMALLLVFVGGGIGSVLRHGVNQISGAVIGINFPWGTLTVNILGSLAMGMLAGCSDLAAKAINCFVCFSPPES